MTTTTHFRGRLSRPGTDASQSRYLLFARGRMLSYDVLDSATSSPRPTVWRPGVRIVREKVFHRPRWAS